MVEIIPLKNEDCKYIVDWNNEKNDFLFQWAGHKVCLASQRMQHQRTMRSHKGHS